jgi:hypothetical protein
VAIFQFEPAQRKNTPPIIAICGPSGSGKTFSSLLLARGVQSVREGPICLIDTENGRAGIYAPAPGEKASEERGTFDFLHLVLGPPFQPIRFAEAIQAAKMHRPACLIIDSGTSEWNGLGGVMTMVDEFQGRNKHGAWKEPRRQLGVMMEQIRQASCPTIITLRAKDKTAQKGGEVIHIGWQPVVDGELPYDMTVSFLLVPPDRGKLHVHRFDHGKQPEPLLRDGVIQDGEMASEEVGRRLALWFAGRPLTQEQKAS